MILTDTVLSNTVFRYGEALPVIHTTPPWVGPTGTVGQFSTVTPLPITTADRFCVTPPGLPFSNVKSLQPGQLQRLLNGHAFIEMDSTPWCMLCFALEHFRTAADHRFVIHEE